MRSRDGSPKTRPEPHSTRSSKNSTLSSRRERESLLFSFRYEWHALGTSSGVPEERSTCTSSLEGAIAMRLIGTILAAILFASWAFGETSAQNSTPSTGSSPTVQATTVPLCPYGYPVGTRAFTRRRLLSNATNLSSPSTTPTTWVCPWGFTPRTGWRMEWGRRMRWRWPINLVP